MYYAQTGTARTRVTMPGMNRTVRFARNTQATVVKGARQAVRRITWQDRAIEVYGQAAAKETSSLQVELAHRLLVLTGRVIAQDSIYANRDERLAVANVDGTVFRLHRDRLVVVRPCAHCGTGEFESPAIQVLSDLGHALSVWEPLHKDCQTEEPELEDF